MKAARRGERKADQKAAYLVYSMVANLVGKMAATTEQSLAESKADL